MRRKPVVRAQAERMARQGHGAEAIARRCGIDRRQGAGAAARDGAAADPEGRTRMTDAQRLAATRRRLPSDLPIRAVLASAVDRLDDRYARGVCDPAPDELPPPDSARADRLLRAAWAGPVVLVSQADPLDVACWLLACWSGIATHRLIAGRLAESGLAAPDRRDFDFGRDGPVHSAGWQVTLPVRAADRRAERR